MVYTTIRIEKATLNILNRVKGFWNYRDVGKKFSDSQGKNWTHDDVLNWLLSKELEQIKKKEE